MANDLTGDFDVIAQFAVPAVNRVLAAMHRIERFPHSMAMRVDDTSRPDRPFDPSVIGVVDAFGDTVSDHSSIRNPRPLNIADFASGSAISSAVAALDPIVNSHLAGVHLEPLTPSHLKGKAQVQVFPPTIEINDSSGTKLTVHMELMSRYIPDQGTPPVAEFIRGDLRVTAPINQVASQHANVVEIDIKASSAVINFTPQWSSSPISAQDLSGISLLIRNALRTSFLPSNATLPSNVAHMQFKTMNAQQGAVAVLIDTDGAAGNPASANQVFLGGTDGFAFGVGANYLHAKFQPTLDKILEQQVEPVKFKIDGLVHTWHITYTITLNSASLDLENGKMVLVVKGHAHTGTSWLPDFNFTFKQDMTLAVSGATAEIAFGNMSIDTSSTIVNLFKSGAMSNLSKVRDRAVAGSNAQATVRKMLSADENLGGFLQSLLSPARGKTPPPPLNFSLAYTSAEIRPTGIILHGTAGVPNWPPPRVEYEPITVSNPGGLQLPENVLDQGPDYSALKTWIPGGTIQRYEWHQQGQSQGFIDDHRFVLLHQAPPLSAGDGAMARAIPGYSPLCLTVHGTRLTASGAVASQPVTATVCGYRSFPLPGDFTVDGGLVALARRGADGMVDIVGHASAGLSAARGRGPNMIVHFADERSAANLAALTQAVSESKRADAPTAVLVVAHPSQMSKLPYSEGISYAEDDGTWRKLYRIKSSSGAATIIVEPGGKIVWESEGAIDAGKLSAVLGKVLVKGDSSNSAMLSANARIGQPPPNFLFEHAPGQQVTLRKLIGREVSIVFFRNSSAPSVSVVRELAGSDGKSRSTDRIVIAVADGESAISSDLGSAIGVVDAERQISAAYGVTMWPTTISVDEMGIIRTIAYGRTTGGKSRA